MGSYYLAHVKITRFVVIENTIDTADQGDYNYSLLLLKILRLAEFEQ